MTTPVVIMNPESTGSDRYVVGFPQPIEKHNITLETNIIAHEPKLRLEINSIIPIARRADGSYILADGVQHTYQVKKFNSHVTIPFFGQRELTIAPKSSKINMTFKNINTITFDDTDIEKHPSIDWIKSTILEKLYEEIDKIFKPLSTGGSNPLQKTNLRVQINNQTRVVYLNKYKTQYVKYKGEFLPLKKAMRLETTQKK